MTYQTTLTRSLGAATLLAAMAVLPMSASAADEAKTKVTAEAYGEEVTITVPMNMLETDEGASTLYAALNTKAEKSCKTTIPKRIGQRVSLRRCKAELMDDFVAGIDNETLTSIHQKA